MGYNRDTCKIESQNGFYPQFFQVNTDEFLGPKAVSARQHSPLVKVKKSEKWGGVTICYFLVINGIVKDNT